MTKNSVVRARIDGRIKTEAVAVLASIGLTVSDAYRMMVRFATEKTLPSEPLILNCETIEAMKAARRGELRQVEPTCHLLASLNVGV
jgi:DNA-damage-inducible protein J